MQREFNAELEGLREENAQLRMTNSELMVRIESNQQVNP